MLNQPGMRDEIPLELPSKLLVIPFEGDMKATGWAANVVKDKLYLLGFDVVEYSEIEPILCENKILPCDVLKDHHRDFLFQKFGIDGASKGEVITANKITCIIGSIRLELIRMESAQILWIGTVDNQKWSVKSEKQRTDIITSSNKLLKRMKNDLESFRKTYHKNLQK